MSVKYEKTMRIPFSPPDISELEIQYVADVLRSGWITTGPRTKELEKKMALWIGTNRMTCLSSQTCAAETCLRLLGVGEGDEVITCAYSYTASASVAAHVGAKIILVDCTPKPGTIEMDYDDLEAAITEKTKVIIPVDLGGIPCDYERIYEIVNRKKHLFHPSGSMQEAIGHVVVVSDAAHALGASYHGRMVGTLADFTNFSFHAVKNFTTAEGGAVTWKSVDGVSDDEIYDRIQLLSLHGQNKDAMAKNKGADWEYDIVGPWYKCNMTDISAAIGLAQLERYVGMLIRRKEIIERYDYAFKPLGLEVLNHYTSEYSSSGHLYITRVFNRKGEPVSDLDRRKIIARMGEYGVATNVHYKPFPLHTAYMNMGFDAASYPNSISRYENEITLPLYSRMTDEEVEYVIDKYIEVVKEVTNEF